MIMIGTGGHVRVAIDVFREQYPDDSIEGILTMNPQDVGKSIDGVPIIGTDDELLNLHHNGVTHAFVGIGDNIRRKRIVKLLQEMGYLFPKLVHPRSTISQFAEIGEGTLVVAGAVVNAGSRIGKQSIINTLASVDHDCTIADYVHISPGVHLAGQTTILEGTHVGIGSVTIPGITVGEWSIIGAGSIIVHHIDPHQVAFGTPCRPVRTLMDTSD